MFAAGLWPIVLGAIASFASAKPARTSARRNNDGGNIEFVTTQNGDFQIKGVPSKFVGTNAYWLHTLSTEQDIDYTLGNISASGIKVVRTWAFNDVTAVPETGTWFQLINNGTVTINEGENGLQKLDTVVKLAEKHGIYLLLVLTNNWNPVPDTEAHRTIGAGPNDKIVPRADEKHPRNYLSNDYGGMDTYVRQFGLKNHDEFYTNARVKDTFMNYTMTIVKRYTNSPAVFAWELANDPRCHSTLTAKTCNPQIITRWHSDVAQHVKKADPNHLVATGNGGGFCIGCPKLFPTLPEITPPKPEPPNTSTSEQRQPTPTESQLYPVPPAPPISEPKPPPPPPPTPSLALGQIHLRRRKVGFITKRRILHDRTAAFKKSRLLKRAQGVKQPGGIQIRGRWTTRVIAGRQEDTHILGPAYDGSYGVDSEDNLNIPEVDVGSFQLFPDQNQYGLDDPNLSRTDNIVEMGSNWIKLHAEAAIKFGKPTTLNGFGLVTQNHAREFIPANSTEAPLNDEVTLVPGSTLGVTPDERNKIFTKWLNIGNGLATMIHYQWGQEGLTVSPGSTIDSQVSSDTGASPNDGYASHGDEQQSVLDVIRHAIQNPS